MSHQDGQVRYGNNRKMRSATKDFIRRRDRKTCKQDDLDFSHPEVATRSPHRNLK